MRSQPNGISARISALEAEGGCIPDSQASERGNVESDHVFHFLDVGIEQRRDGSRAGIVDEQADARIVLQLCFHPRALAGDLARSDKRLELSPPLKIRHNIELLASLIRDTNKTDKNIARSDAVMAYCAMIGAISMAHQHGPPVSDRKLSREILKTVAQRLKPGTTREQ